MKNKTLKWHVAKRERKKIKTKIRSRGNIKQADTELQRNKYRFCFNNKVKNTVLLMQNYFYIYAIVKKGKKKKRSTTTSGEKVRIKVDKMFYKES